MNTQFIHISPPCCLGCCVFSCSVVDWSSEEFSGLLPLWCNIPWASDCHQGGPPMLGRRADLTLCVMALRAHSPGRPLCPFNGTHSEVEICWHWCRKHGHKNMRPSLKRQGVLLMTKLKEEARLIRSEMGVVQGIRTVCACQSVSYSALS